MATGLVIHISSGADRHTEILTDERVRIGNSEGSDLRLRSSALPKNSSNCEGAKEESALCFNCPSGLWRAKDVAQPAIPNMGISAMNRSNAIALAVRDELCFQRDSKSR